MSKGDAHLTGPQITSEHNKYSEVKISEATVKRRLCDNNLFGRRPSQKPLISKKKQMARVKFAKEHLFLGVKCCFHLMVLSMLDIQDNQTQRWYCNGVGMFFP